METLAHLFSYVCGQVHLFEVGGEPLPICQRCAGLYFGSAYSSLLAGLRPRASSLMLWLHGICMLMMIPFGYHLIHHGPLLRVITGQLFAYGFVYYLLLIIPGNHNEVRSRTRTAIYFFALALGIVALPLIARFGSHWAGDIVLIGCTAGVFILLLLTLANCALLGFGAVRSLSQRKRLLQS